jgi:hypothetical protein
MAREAAVAQWPVHRGLPYEWGGVRGDPNRNSCLRYFVDFLLQPLLFQNPTCPSAPPSATARWSIGGGGLVSARSSSS